MVRDCYVCSYLCKKTRKNKAATAKTENQTVSLHKFPSDLTILQAWLNFCDLTSRDNVSTTRICDLHFTTDSFNNFVSGVIPGKNRRLILRRNAIPTILEPRPEIENNNPIILPNNATTADNNNQSRIQGEKIVLLTSSPVKAETQKNANATNVLISIPTNRLIPIKKTADEGSPPKRFFNPRYPSEITLNDFSNPADAKRNLAMLQDTIKKKTLEITRLRSQNKNLRKKTVTLDELVLHLKKKCLINDQAAKTLKNIPQIVQDIVSRNEESRDRKYPPSVISFALTLRFYSPKAYMYVRKIFKNRLPHPSTIRTWNKEVRKNKGLTTSEEDHQEIGNITDIEEQSRLLAASLNVEETNEINYTTDNYEEEVHHAWGDEPMEECVVVSDPFYDQAD